MSDDDPETDFRIDIPFVLTEFIRAEGPHVHFFGDCSACGAEEAALIPLMTFLRSEPKQCSACRKMTLVPRMETGN